jgi:hypothetical protein
MLIIYGFEHNCFVLMMFGMIKPWTEVKIWMYDEVHQCK